MYDQIRYIDNQGREEIRVNYANNQTTVVPNGLLQGDEFCIVATGIHKRKDAELIAQKILSLVSSPVPFREQTLAVSGSLSICIPKPGDMDQDKILDTADDAM